ncbi:hypothetical protein [Ramlibacter sp. WS9]|uniref:hypothetical protein n=1 Tax=Ramlibacter sp. WS9 TaxID=1882741 RepID=UPI001141F1A4|nr:hypothetical protein [Ramlibacter sp. WS9]ROZ71511.1 hypothetical protein EEB15_20945 [Ramlibacter sp. WS9]
MTSYYLWLLAYLPLLLVVFLLFWRNRAMKKHQDKLVADLQGKRYWRINLSRPAFHQRWWRVMPFEAKGVLVDEGDRLRIRGFWLKDRRAFDSLFDKGSSAVEWLGNRNLRAGNLHWAKLTTPRGEMNFCADTGMYALPSREALADIFRGTFPAYALAEEQTSDFALEKSPRSIVIVVLFFVLLFFSLIDTFVVTRFELADSQLARILFNPLVWGGALACAGVCDLLAYRYLLTGRVPARESLVLSLMLSAALLGAALPAAKRVDQGLDGNGIRNYSYRLASPTRLEPVDMNLGLPTLRFPRAIDYWAQFRVGSEHQVPFVRGPMGLWQLDHGEFDKPLIAFYEKQGR